VKRKSLRLAAKGDPFPLFDQVGVCNLHLENTVGVGVVPAPRAGAEHGAGAVG
jgi:hypothetical protein